MLEKKFVILLAVVNLAAFIGLLIWFVRVDREAPVITVEKEIVYTKEISEEEILAGVRAWDEQDGDVTDSLVIEKMIPNEEKQTVLVSCGAQDKSGNIVKHSFRIPCDDSVFSNEEREVFELAVGEAENMLSDAADVTDEESASEEETESGEETTEEMMEEAASDEAETEETTIETEEQEAPGPAEEEEHLQPEPVAQNDPEQTSDRPILEFSVTEVKTTLGYNPAWVTVISQLKDDKDTYQDLLGRLKITGNYDNKTVGSYDVSVTTTDSDGNESVPSTIRIIVE